MNYGVYFNVAPIEVPLQALYACRNVRIDNGRLTNRGVGWSLFSPDWTLNGTVTLVDTFLSQAGAQKLIFATLTDIYEWIESTDDVLFLTPRYATGTASCSSTTAVTGSGTSWAANAKAGDFISFGDAADRDPASTWYEIDTVNSDTSITLTEAGPTVAGSDYTIRQTMTMAEGDVWSTDLFHNGLPGPADFWIGTNGRDYVFSWDGSATQVTSQSGFGFTCKALRRWSNMMIYANLNVSGTRRRTSVHNSAIGDPFNVTTLEAAEFVAYDGTNEILSMLPLAEYLIIYANGTVTVMSLVGGDTLFAFRVALNGIGPLSANAVVDLGDHHEFLSSDAAYHFDGVSISEICYQVMREVIRRMPADRYHQIIAHQHEERGYIAWISPQTDDENGIPNTAYLEHYLEVVPDKVPIPCTIQDMPASATGYFERITTLTWDAISGTWADQTYRWDDRFYSGAYPLNLFGSYDGKIYAMGGSDTQAGIPVSSYAQTGMRPVVDGLRRGCVTRVIPFAEKVEGAAYTLQVKVHSTDQVGGEQVPSSEFSYDLTHSSHRFVNPYVTGRFFSVEFGTNGLSQSWTLQGYDVETAALGERW